MKVDSGSATLDQGHSRQGYEQIPDPLTCVQKHWGPLDGACGILLESFSNAFSMAETAGQVSKASGTRRHLHRMDDNWPRHPYRQLESSSACRRRSSTVLLKSLLCTSLPLVH